MTTPLGNRTEEVKRLRSGGMSVADIAAKFGVTKATVYNDLKGTKAPKVGRKAKNPETEEEYNIITVFTTDSEEGGVRFTGLVSKTSLKKIVEIMVGA